jgi:hypothetical protein
MIVRSNGTWDAKRRPRLGQALAEFALVAPIFFLLLFAIIEGGRLIFYYHTLGNATREGARYAIIHGMNAADLCPSGPMPGTLVNWCDPAADNVKQAVRDAAFGLVGTGDFDQLIVEYPEANQRGDVVRVYAEYSYDPLMPLLPPFTISAESTLVINN